MKNLFIGFCLFSLILIMPIMGQLTTGNIYGTVVEPDGAPLPGVRVSLTGQYTAPIDAITGAEGTFRFIRLAPSQDYVVTAELQGFKKAIQENIRIIAGQNRSVELVMEMGTIQEEITVTAPVHTIDLKKTAVGVQFT